MLSLLAFILTYTSHDYFGQLSRSVAYGGDATHKTSHVVGEKNDQYINASDNEADDREGSASGEPKKMILPDFLPPELANVLPAAQQSLLLLRTAQPDHPLLRTSPSFSAIRWFWSESEISAAWEYHQFLPQSDVGLSRATITDAQDLKSASFTYKPEICELSVFDLEPGSQLVRSAVYDTTGQSTLESFIASFPSGLPAITPTLPHLTSLVFSRLVLHASSLSNALLSLLLQSPGILNVQAHLKLLQSYLLLTSPAFKSRLASALFSDTTEFEDDNSTSLSLHTFRRIPGQKQGQKSQPWAVGLAPALLDRETWPPIGADLSFFLRTVIVDSFESTKELDGRRPARQVLEEAEYRLGFAIRDLPTGPGRDKWLNPLGMCLTALHLSLADCVLQP